MARFFYSAFLNSIIAVFRYRIFFFIIQYPLLTLNHILISITKLVRWLTNFMDIKYAA